MEGKAIYILPDGTKYEGDFKNGTAEGKGTQIFANGNKY